MFSVLLHLVIFVAEQYVEHFTLLSVSVYTHKEYIYIQYVNFSIPLEHFTP